MNIKNQKENVLSSLPISIPSSVPPRPAVASPFSSPPADRLHGSLPGTANHRPFRYGQSIMEPKSFTPVTSGVTFNLNGEEGYFSSDNNNFNVQVEIPTSTDEDCSEVSFLLNQRPVQSAPIHQFFLDIAVAFHTYGAPTSHIEILMKHCCNQFGIHSSWIVFPSALVVTFGDPGSKESMTCSIKNDQGFGPFSKYYDVQQLIEMLINGECEIETAKIRLSEIRERGFIYNRALRLLAWAFSSMFSATLFFGGGWIDMGISFVMGIFVYLIYCIGEWKPKFSYFSTLAEALITSVGISVISSFIDSDMICVSSLILSPLIWEFPGIALTLAIQELVTKNLITGTGRLFYAILTALMIGYGIAVGIDIPFWIKPDLDKQCIPPVGPVINILWVILISFSFNILMDIKLIHFPATTVVASVGYWTSYFLSNLQLLNADHVAFLSAFFVTITANLLSRWKRNSSLLYLLTGLILLVPGSLGVRGAAKILGNDYASGSYITLQMITVGLSLTIGTIVATAILPPREFALKPS